MNIRLLRICSVAIRINSSELHVYDTWFLNELHNLERCLTMRIVYMDYIYVHKVDT